MESQANPSVVAGNEDTDAPSRDAPDDSRSAGSSVGCRVQDIIMGAKDSRGSVVDHVYFKRKSYAVYSSDGKIYVTYADDDEVASEQISNTADLVPLRDSLQFLMMKKNHPTCYVPQIAEAFRLGLENKQTVAKATLENAMNDALGNQAKAGRLLYLMFAVPFGLAAAAVLIWAGATTDASSALKLLLLAAGGGSVGALLSITIAIRGRTVAVDGDWKSNGFDAFGRLLIGVISAAVLFLVLTAGIIAQVKAGDATLVGKDASWQVALVIGFAAGFFERLVPDLLAKGLDERQGAVPSSSTPQ